MNNGQRRQSERAPLNKAGEDPESRSLGTERVSKDEQLAELNLRFENFTDAGPAATRHEAATVSWTITVPQA